MKEEFALRRGRSEPARERRRKDTARGKGMLAVRPPGHGRSCLLFFDSVQLGKEKHLPGGKVTERRSSSESALGWWAGAGVDIGRKPLLEDGRRVLVCAEARGTPYSRSP